MKSLLLLALFDFSIVEEKKLLNRIRIEYWVRVLEIKILVSPVEDRQIWFRPFNTRIINLGRVILDSFVATLLHAVKFGYEQKISKPEFGETNAYVRIYSDTHFLSLMKPK